MWSSLLVLCAVATLSLAGPCDIYAAAGNTCVAAHATTRALYNAYSGSLYQLKRTSDGATTNIGPVSAGGVANAAAHDSFCASTTCLISIIYDQSGRGNHLTQGVPGGFNGPDVNGLDNLAGASGAPVLLNGKKAYGVFVSPGTGYRNDATNGIATGDTAEGMYAVLDGTHYNGGCCFDYGNAETSAHDTGAGHMEAIYFGTESVWGTGAGSGPWIMADLENGLYSGGSTGQHTADPTQTARFITGVVKGEPGLWSIRGAASTSSSLTTYWSGSRPSGYSPMSKEGAIILGIGGDNSNSAQGTFYEGAMLAGYPSDATENSVQANIASMDYATTSLASGSAVNVGSAISLRATTACCTSDYIYHSGTTVGIAPVSSSNSSAAKLTASWNVVSPLASEATGCISLQSRDTTGSYIRHQNFQLFLDANDGSQQFHEDATFCPQTGLNGQGNTFRPWGYPARNIRHFDFIAYIASDGGVQTFDTTSTYNDDASFVVSAAWA
ncbi:Glycoside hydrolase family 54 protein [Mycena chlorophos]|uniref:Alpha-L-arabinofuranosidase n=1 Tax=Mycena chlorophos TaxID=658473 RepID=A0A8H6SYP2_MYCCL|nr:Glycoside hydrolase family 54 protein [Mycena chlorophos]